MVEIGRSNKLKAKRRSEFGIFLDGGGRGDILLPRRYVPEAIQIGDEIEVFVHYDSEDRLVATTETPLVQVGGIARLIVSEINQVGAFLDWGLGKNLFLPYSEQTLEIEAGDPVVVTVDLDKSDRIRASMKLDRTLSKETPPFSPGDKVQALVVAQTDLGFKAIVEGQFWGLLYGNEVFQPISYADELTVHVKEVREDGKIDLILQAPGHYATEDIGARILSQLEAAGGFLEINSKTSAETIYDLFGVSKKKYKIALGGLYKKRLITITDDGVRLV